MAAVTAVVPPPRLRPPRLPDGLLPRPQLMRRLDEAAGMLGTVLAPAGFGKTTLLAQWANAARPGTVAWLSLDESEGSHRCSGRT
jgi:LuxR family maltose regulon positive regulatory protein